MVKLLSKQSTLKIKGNFAKQIETNRVYATVFFIYIVARPRNN